MNKKEIKRKIRLLRKFKKDTKVGTENRRTINRQIRELKKKINNTYNCNNPEKKIWIDKINAVKKHYTDLRQFTIEQLKYHYEKIKEKI